MSGDESTSMIGRRSANSTMTCQMGMDTGPVATPTTAATRTEAIPANSQRPPSRDLPNPVDPVCQSPATPAPVPDDVI